MQPCGAVGKDCEQAYHSNAGEAVEYGKNKEGGHTADYITNNQDGINHLHQNRDKAKKAEGLVWVLPL